MAKTPEKPETEPELRPDGWERFEKAVDAAMKPSPKQAAEQNQTIDIDDLSKAREKQDRR